MEPAQAEARVEPAAAREEQKAKPVLGQQEEGKRSRTDNCHCPDVSRSCPYDVNILNSQNIEF